MKRDMELIRLLLLEQEQDEGPPELAAYSIEDIVYNRALILDAGLIDGELIRGERGEPLLVNVYRLTWAGHDFLDATRDSKVWKLAKEHILKPGASWTFPVLLEWLKQEAHKRVFGTQASS